jgi:hypothetical protein
LDWQRTGLNPPAAMVDAVTDYQSETDLLADFIDIHCITSLDCNIPVKTLYETYISYCDNKNLRSPMSRQKFNEDLLGRQGIDQRRLGAGRTRTWIGIGLKPPHLATEQPNVTHSNFGRLTRSCETCDIPPLACPIPESRRDAETCSHFRPLWVTIWNYGIRPGRPEKQHFWVFSTWEKYEKKPENRVFLVTLV